jgi:hypothetical protein
MYIEIGEGMNQPGQWLLTDTEKTMEFSKFTK